jgi:hypothetical protein
MFISLFASHTHPVGRPGRNTNPTRMLDQLPLVTILSKKLKREYETNEKLQNKRTLPALFLRTLPGGPEN